MAKSASKSAKKPVKTDKKADKKPASSKTAKAPVKKAAKPVAKKPAKPVAQQQKKAVAKAAPAKASPKKVEVSKKGTKVVATKGASKKANEKDSSLKGAVKKPVVVKKDEKIVKTAEKSAPVKEKLAVSAEKTADKTASKKAVPAPKGKGAKAPSKTAKKNNEEELEDVLFDDDLGDSEITEYEEELAIVEEIDEVEEVGDEEVVAEVKDRDSEEIILTDAEGRRYCRARDCDQAAIVDAYCRFHYLLFWKKIQSRKKILADGKLERYIEELTSRYPDKFLEMIRRDLRTEKDFLAAIQELEIDESSNENDFEEDTSAFIEEVRGMGEPTGVEDDEF